MSYRQRALGITAVSAETAYGDGNKVVTMVNDAPISFDVGKSVINLNRKAGSMIENQYSSITGRKEPVITLESPLYSEFLSLLSAYLDVNDTTDIDDFDTESFCIRQLTPSSSTAGSGIEAVGCKPQSISLSQSDSLWQISVPFNAQDLEIEKSVTGLSGESLTVRPTTAPLRFVQGRTAQLTVIGAGGGTTTTGTAINLEVEALNLTLNFERADDAKVWRNSQERVNDLICQLGGEISITYTWDDVNPLDDYIYDDDTKFRFTYDAIGGLDISVDFKMTNFEKPDDTTCVYSATITGTIIDSWAIGMSDTTTTA